LIFFFPSTYQAVLSRSASETSLLQSRQDPSISSQSCLSSPTFFGAKRGALSRISSQVKRTHAVESATAVTHHTAGYRSTIAPRRLVSPPSTPQPLAGPCPRAVTGTRRCQKKFIGLPRLWETSRKEKKPNKFFLGSTHATHATRLRWAACSARRLKWHRR
jgi:hypothetical protein